MSDTLIHRIVHITSTFDPSTRLPLVVLDSSEFPTPSSNLYSTIVPQIIKNLPQSNFVLLFFACGAPNKPSWSWVAKTYSMLEKNVKKRVKKIYVVHESWWVRAITEMLRGVVSTKFKRKVVHVTSLSQLAQLIDITVINIKPKIYLHNKKIENEITIPRHPTPVFGMKLNINDEIIIPKVWIEGIEYLFKNGYSIKELFKRPENDNTFAALQVILRDCYDRNQLISLYDYGPRVIASLLRLFIYQLPSAILTSPLIVMINNGEDSIKIIKSINIENQYLLIDLIDLLAFLVRPSDDLRPCNTSGSLAACIGPSLLGNTNGDSTNIVSSVRFTKLLIENWTAIRQELNTGSPSSDSTIIPHRKTSAQSISSLLDNFNSIPMTRVRTYPSMQNIYTEIRQDSRSSSTSSTISTSSITSTSSSEFIIDSSTTSQSIPPPPPPPPIPRKLKNQLTDHPTNPLQTTKSSNIISTKPSISKSSLPTIPAKRSSIQPAKNIVRRGKMVAELAKLYEEKCNTAEILIKIDNRK